ncbi:MAG: hypothetical protein JWP65_2541 [Ramlibacter sp.]|jgi:hypothetical protein|uniref:hypothetical protein n=1 Tax=Ramlibacter sp. TaxID=1917967 RepID=UPI00261838AC|nr:hypothetical protein [Ramlibacter sp.]MDB5752120.1 hypothetical protein [Ramlibacter sp.]
MFLLAGKPTTFRRTSINQPFLRCTRSVLALGLPAALAGGTALASTGRQVAAQAESCGVRAEIDYRSGHAVLLDTPAEPAWRAKWRWSWCVPTVWSAGGRGVLGDVDEAAPGGPDR